MYRPRRKAAELNPDEQELAAQAWAIVQPLLTRAEREWPGLNYSGAVAESLCRLVSSFDPKKSSIKTWAIVHAQYAILQARRDAAPCGCRRPNRSAKPVRARIVSFGTIYDVLDPRDDQGSIDTTEFIQCLLSNLDSFDRNLVWQTVVEGRTFMEMGAELGISKSWAQALQARALARMRTQAEANPSPA